MPTDSPATPLYLRLAREIAADIASGTLAAGARLPTHRMLAHERGVTIGTISRAYAELQREGLVQATVGRGSFVRALSRDASAPRESDLRANHPPPSRLGPALLRSLNRTLDRIESGLFDIQNVLSSQQRYSDLATAWLERSHGVPPGREPILANGGQQALACALMALCRPGDLVLTEESTYIGLIMVARSLGLRLVGVPMDADGLLPSVLEQLCAQEAPKVLVCTPNFHSPTTATLDEGRRRQIAALAERHDFCVIEDDVYGAYSDERIPPFRVLLPERSVLFTSFAKVAAPGLPAALISASEALRAPILEQLRVMAGSLIGLTWDILVDWMEIGFLDELVAMNRREIEARNHLAGTLLAGLDVASRRLCPHIWLRLPPGSSPSEFGARLYAAGVKVLGSDQFAVGHLRGAPAVRISLSAARDRAELKAALTLVREVALTNFDIGRPLA